MSYPTAYFTNKELESMTAEALNYELREAEALLIHYDSEGWRNYARRTQDSIERIQKELRRKQELTK